MSLCSAVLLAACGGSGGGAGAPTGGGGATPSTTLSISPSALVLSVNDTVSSPTLTGKPRVFTVTNIGTANALAVIQARSTGSPAWPNGTNPSSNCPTTLAPGASCTITVTPGIAPSAAQGDTSPVPITLSVGGSNTNLLSPTVQVLTHGSVYQGGYVFSIDDTTPNTGNIRGKVVALNDASPGVIWSSNGNGGAPVDVAYNIIPGVDELSTPVGGICNGGTDGACNTEEITRVYTGVNNAYYAAGACRATIAAYTDWYLPAVCELGSDASPGCAGAQSMQANLIDNNALSVGTLPTAISYWSSTPSNAAPDFNAWAHQFGVGILAASSADLKHELHKVRCVRALTL